MPRSKTAFPEAKNSQHYERIHGRPEPRISRGQAGGGRWTAEPISPRSPDLIRLLFNGAVGPMSADPECQREWAIARAMCQGRAPVGATSASRGWDLASCMRGMVSARCGGNPIKSAYAGRNNDECGCDMPLSPEQRQSLPSDVVKCHDLFEAGRHRELIAWMTSLLADQAEDWHYRWRAAAFEASGNNAAAREDYARLVERADERLRESPTLWHSWYERGLAHASAGSHEAACADFTRVIEMKPDIYGPRVERARALIALNRFHEALEDADVAKELNWSDPVPGFDLLRAECYLGLGDMEAASACLAFLPKELDPDTEAYRQELSARCTAHDMRR